MVAKLWTNAEIRRLALQSVEGRQQIASARGEYLRALIGSAQVALEDKDTKDQVVQMAAVKVVHRRFYPVVQEAVTTLDIKLDKKAPLAKRKRDSLERNRRTNFARSAYGTIRRWLRAPGHDLMKLDAQTVTKSQLLEEAPPARKHALTPQRIHARADRLIDQLVGFARMVSKIDQASGSRVVEAALQRLTKMVAANVQATTDATLAAREGRPLRVGRTVFFPMEAERKAA